MLLVFPEGARPDPLLLSTQGKVESGPLSSFCHLANPPRHEGLHRPRPSRVLETRPLQLPALAQARERPN